MKAAHAGRAARRVREERLAAGRRVVDVANRRGAEFLVVAGDLFEDNAVGGTLVQQTGDVLAAFEGPVYLLPGNHDPLQPGSVWEHPVWESHENLHLLSEAEPVEVTGGTLHPCPVREKHSRSDPTRVIPDAGEGIRVGIAHGTVEGVPVETPDFPVPRDAADRRGVSYLALGHWHSTSRFASPDGAERMAYCGTHETTRFGERDSGNVLLVTIPAPAAAPEIEVVPTGGLAWLDLREEVRSPEDLEEIRNHIEGASAPERTLLRLRLSGALPAAAFAELDRIREVALSRFLGARIDADAIRPSPEDTGWIEDLPDGHVRAAAEHLRELSVSPDEGQAAEASLALLELFVLSREAGG
jgi:DNA repair exonuclease SbcCD nuclease subunit